MSDPAPPHPRRGGLRDPRRHTGRIKLDDELRDVRALDAIRVRPDVARALEAGPDGLEFLAVGPHHQGDGEPVDDPWVA